MGLGDYETGRVTCCVKWKPWMYKNPLLLFE